MMEKSNNSASDLALLQEAIAIAEELQPLDSQFQLKKLSALDTSPEVKRKVVGILEKLQESNDDFLKKIPQSLFSKLSFTPENIGSYRIHKLIGQGGMSNVYLATLSRSNHKTPVALKILSPLLETEKAIHLFKREQEILSKLKHPNITTYFDGGKSDNGIYYLAMELIDEPTDIYSYVSENNCSEKEIVSLVLKVAEVLEYAHDKGILHRDIKASNILIDSSDNIKVIDFGIARFDQANENTLTMVFSPCSASPEQILGKEVSVRSDIFSLSALLLELLTKRKPLPNAQHHNYDPQNDVKHMLDILRTSEIDADLAKVIKKGMSINPDFRFKQMTEFGRCLKLWLSGEKVKFKLTDVLYGYYTSSKAYQFASKYLALFVVVILSYFLINRDFTKRTDALKAESSNAVEILDSIMGHLDGKTAKTRYDNVEFALNTVIIQRAEILEKNKKVKYLLYSKLAELQQYNKPDKTVLETLEIAKESLVSSPGYDKRAEIQLDLQRMGVLLNSGLFEMVKKEAHALLDELNNNTTEFNNEKVMLYLALIQVYRRTGSQEETEQIEVEIVNLIENSPNIQIEVEGHSYNAMAITREKRGNISEALVMYKKAIDLLYYQKLDDITLATIFSNYANLKYKSNAYGEIDLYFKKSLSIIEGINSNHPNAGLIKFQYAGFLHSQGEFSKAMDLLDQAIENINGAGAKLYLSWAMTRKAKFLFDAGKRAESLKTFFTSLILNINVVGLNNKETLKLIKWGAQSFVPVLFNTRALSNPITR